MKTAAVLSLLLAVARPGAGEVGHLARDAHRRPGADRWLLYEGSPMSLEPVPPPAPFSHFRDDKYNHFSFHVDDLPTHDSGFSNDRIQDIGLQSLFGPPNPDENISKLDELTTKKRYTKKSNAKNAEKSNANKGRSDKRSDGTTNEIPWKKSLGESISRDYPWNRSGDSWGGKGGGITKLRRAGALGGTGGGGGGGWSKRGGGPPQLPAGLASQLMLRSVRGNRQYDVPQIGE